MSGQKKLIVDEAVIPSRSVFEYETTCTMPATLTIDGALDATAHALGVSYGVPAEKYDLVAQIAETAISLVVEYAGLAVADGTEREAREALGLAADLGGYAIMVGGTNGAHLTSFSLVDVTSHGRACGLTNAY